MRFHVQPHLPTLLKISSVKYSQSIYSLFFRMDSSTLGLNTKFCTHFLSSHHEYTNNVVCKGLPCFPRFFVQGNLSPVNTKRKKLPGRTNGNDFCQEAQATVTTDLLLCNTPSTSGSFHFLLYLL